MRPNTKTLTLVLFLGVAAIAVCGSPLDDAEREWEEFEVRRSSSHPWTTAMPLPSTLAEAGLTAPVRLCSVMPLHRDGGSTGGFVRDSKGSYLAFAIARPFWSLDDSFNPRPAFYLGDTCWHVSGTVRVPYDSPCEKMLIGFLGESWKRIEEDHIDAIKRAREHYLQDPKTFAVRLQQCDEAIADYERRKAAQPGATDNPDDAHRI